MEQGEVVNPRSADCGAGDYALAGWLQPGRGGRSVLGYWVLIMALSLYFAYTREVSYRLLPIAILPGFALSLALAGFERLLLAARRRLAGEMSGVQAGFLLFFVALIGNILFSSILLSMPLCWAMEQLLGQPSLCKEFALFSVNYSLLLALVSWLGWFCSGCRPAPCALDDQEGGSQPSRRKHLTMGENLVYFRVFISQLIARGKKTGAHFVR